METKQWERIEELFHATLELEAAARPDYLLRECLDDEERREVESLITSFENSPSFINTSNLSLGMRVLTKSSDSMVGKSVGQYKIVSALGKGGMGDVYLAEDTKLGRKVALKFLSQEFIGDNWAKRQLIKEAQAVAMLDHPNICPVYGIEEEEGRSFIVMQYVEGETLADLIRTGRPDSTQVLALAKQIVGALAEAHAHGIIHRDIKPKNIMVTRSGQVKVLDFGLAKTIQQHKGFQLKDDSVSHLSQNGLLAGTVAYMSPEQLRGERLDFRSDIFNLGTVLYELIEGRRPFAHASEAETIAAILSKEPSSWKNLHAHSSPLYQILQKCLEKDRDNRYVSASEMLIALGQTPVTKTPQRFNRHSAPWVIGTVAILVVLVALTLFLVQLPKTNLNATPALRDQPITNAPVYSLAVMPVTSQDPDESSEYLTEGFTESLIEKLSSLSQLRISPYTSVSGYKGSNMNPSEIGRELHVDVLLVGQVVRQGQKQILQSQLIKTIDGSQIWSGDEEIKWQTVIDLENQLSRSVARVLDLQLAAEKKFLASHGTRNPEAFREYMMGRHYWRHRDKENITRAISHFKDAIRLDPIYAQAWAGLADCYVLLSLVSFGEMPTEEAMSQATAAAKEALTADDTLPEAHTALGVVNLRYNWDWTKAEKEFKRAIELNPDYAPAHLSYSQLLLIKGQREAAIAESEKAKILDPFSPPSVMNLCRTLSLARQYDKAISCYDKLIRENPKFDHAKYLRALVYQRSGRYEEALSEFQSLYLRNRPLAGAALGYAYGRVGRTAEARRVLAEMETLAKRRFVPPIEFAIIHIGLGDKDKAFFWLEAAYKERFATLIYITVDPIFSSLHDDPRFTSLVERLKLPPPSSL